MKLKHVVLVIASVCMAVAQTKTKFVDNSPGGSPIRLAESRDNATGTCSITALNTDKRPAAAVVVDFEPGMEGGRMTHDHLFRPDDHVSMHGYEFPIENFPCDTKEVTVKTMFVQFNDGQVWEGSDAKPLQTSPPTAGKGSTT